MVALLTGDGGTTITGSTLTSTAGTDAALATTGGTINLFLGSDVLTTLAPSGVSLSVNSPGPVVATGALNLRADLRLSLIHI